MPRAFPDSDVKNPIILADGSLHEGTVFLSAAIDHPRITVGAYSYASSFDPPEDWATRLAPYLFPQSPEQLIIGKFCQIADAALFITASANHRYDGFSTFPFAVFDGGFDDARPSLPKPGKDTVLGHDIWVGQGVRVLPGAQIGSGTILGAGSVVSGTVPPYSVVAGNPGRIVRNRFDTKTVARLLELAWWDWPMEQILSNEAAICGADLSVMETAAS